MTTPISTQGTARIRDQLAPGATKSTPQAAPTQITTFTRSEPQTKTATNVRLGQKQQPVAAAMTGKRTLNDAQLQAMGAEILHLYKEKVIGGASRRLDFKSEGETYSVRGGDINNILIHTKDGSIQLRPDGMPTRNISLPIESWESLELGLARTLATLRHT